MIVGLVLHGDAPGERELRLLDACDVLVCADGGANGLVAAGRIPDWIVGDFDSIDPAVLEKCRGANLVELPRRKDFTDGEAALKKALELSPRRLLIAGAHGGSTAHFLANVALLRRAQASGVETLMVGAGETLRFVPAPGRLPLPPRGARFHLLPEAGGATVTLQGTAYDIERQPLAWGSSRGLSNRVERDGALLSVHEGVVLLVAEGP
ncbi:MAG TPA: thiamine diphosphokinase [Candidatus Thermoplasmatota archaeon]|nr:thiamine diphosphokinase [Candidatus Thermoplasmatota archaeon]